MCPKYEVILRLATMVFFLRNVIEKKEKKKNVKNFKEVSALLHKNLNKNKNKNKQFQGVRAVARTPKLYKLSIWCYDQHDQLDMYM